MAILGTTKLLVNNQGVSGDSPDYVDAQDGNSVILEAWPVAVGIATVQLIDSADPTTGFFPCVASNGLQSGLTGRTKVQIDNVLQYLKVRITVSSGLWCVRVSPILSAGQATINATVTGTVGQGAPGTAPGAWFVQGGADLAGGNDPLLTWPYRGAKLPFAVTFSTVAAEISSATSPTPNRHGLLIFNAGTVTAYLGNAGVTAATGIPLAPGAALIDNASSDGWFGITAAGTADLRGFRVDPAP